MKHHLYKAAIGSTLLLGPLAAFAQGPQLSNVRQLIEAIGDIINLLLPIAVAIALLAFFYGLIQYIRGANDPAAAGTGKSIMIAGVIALFVMVSVWGIVRFIGNALGIDRGTTIPVPGVEERAGGAERGR